MVALLSVLSPTVWAQASTAAPAGRDPATIATVQPNADDGMDLLEDALTCRVSYERYPLLMRQLRRDRPDDFTQAYRQYSKPPMDLYRLQAPIDAWGNQADTILVSPNRVLMAVEGSLDEVTAKLEHSFEASSQSPLSGSLDNQHGLVIYAADQPGLEGMVLLGCEYRINDVSLLEDPDDAWRKPRAVPSAPASPATPARP